MITAHRHACLLAIVTLSFAPAQAQEREQPLAADLSDYMFRLDKLGFTGVVAVELDGESILSRGYGLADREHDLPWTPQTASTIGSITKQFTGAAILALVEDGQLSVEETLGDHFEDVPVDKHPITIHQLLTHSSGITDLREAGDWDPIGRAKFVRRILAQELSFAPGTDYDYSNAGYSLLGAIIERVTGDSYESFVRARLFHPLGMEHTGYILADYSETVIAQGYEGSETWGTVLERPMAEDGPYWVLRANGGIHSTAEDMLRWGQALMNGEVLSPQSMKEYWSPHVDEGGGESFYGYGWVTLEVVGHRIITHNGGNRIFFADMALVPESGLTVFMMTNTIQDFTLAQQLLEQIIPLIVLGQALPEVPNVADASPAGFAELAGRYSLPAGGALSVQIEGNVIQIEALDPPAFSVLLSTETVDTERADRFNATIDRVATAYVRHDDLEPLWEAYGQSATIERLENGWRRRKAELEEEHGPIKGHRVLGTAFRDGRDVTLLRIECEHGHADRAYVWDPEGEADLLGVSARGLDPTLHVYPLEGGGYASWDGRSGASVRVDFAPAGDGALEMTLGADSERRARRLREGR
jgi:CubicO group peptidase (beta-lactamase class C family)